MNDGSDELGEASLAVASGRIFAMTAQKFLSSSSGVTKVKYLK
jgi:hypothetical protein